MWKRIMRGKTFILAKLAESFENIVLKWSHLVSQANCAVKSTRTYTSCIVISNWKNLLSNSFVKRDALIMIFINFY